MSVDRNGYTVCPRCDRRYYMDFVGTGKLTESLLSAKIIRPFCAHCQRQRQA